MKFINVEVKNGEAIPPFPHTSSWRGAYLIKHRDTFIVTERRGILSHSWDVPVSLFGPDGGYILMISILSLILQGNTG
jgi:hypothetical protein